MNTTTGTNCRNCSKEVTGKFCSDCGYPRELKRIDGQYITAEIRSILNFEKGIFYTIKELFVRPGATVKSFIERDRSRIVKPIIFLIFCSLIYTIGQQFLNYETGYINFNIEDPKNPPVVVKVFNWFSQNYGYANILMAIFIAMWIRIFFRKHNYNYYEIYTLLCYLIGNSVLIYTLLGIVETIVDFPVLQLGIFAVSIYCSWGIAQFFDQHKKMNYIKGFLSYLFGIVTSLILFFGVGIGLSLLFTH